MPGRSKTKEKLELLAGVVTMALAVVLLVITLLCMRTCTAAPPETTAPEASLQPITTAGLAEPTLAVNPYGAGDFAYDHGYLTCISGESRLGVDVSEYQGAIQWNKVADAGVDFAIIRAGFRAWGSEGALHEDIRFGANLQGATDAGLQAGVYFFSQAVSVEEAREEARFVLELLDGRALSMPVVFDWEFVPDANARTAGMTGEKLTACALAFCQEIAAGGYEPMVYFNLDMASRMLDLQQIQDAGYGFWLAMYSTSMTYPYRIDMWQYSSGGSVDGIPTFVDLNLYFVYE